MVAGSQPAAAAAEGAAVVAAPGVTGGLICSSSLLHICWHCRSQHNVHQLHSTASPSTGYAMASSLNSQAVRRAIISGTVARDDKAHGDQCMRKSHAISARGQSVMHDRSPRTVWYGRSSGRRGYSKDSYGGSCSQRSGSAPPSRRSAPQAWDFGN